MGVLNEKRCKMDKSVYSPPKTIQDMKNEISATIKRLELLNYDNSLLDTDPTNDIVKLNGILAEMNNNPNAESYTHLFAKKQGESAENQRNHRKSAAFVVAVPEELAANRHWQKIDGGIHYVYETT